MASLYLGPNGEWRIRFRFSGRQYYRALDTTDEDQAVNIKKQAEETIDLLKRGRISLPEGASVDEAGLFIISGGRTSKTPQAAPQPKTLEEIKAQYFEDLPDGAKADNSLSTEKIHAAHLVRHLRGSTQLQKIGIPELQAYVTKRSREDGRRGKKVQPETIRKELATFRQIWNYARTRGWVAGGVVLKEVKLPKAAEKPPFQTWDEIERKIKRGGLKEEEIAELWDGVFLREKEVADLLKHVEKEAKYAFVHPMIAFAALTGARRSEILRSQVDDFNFDQKFVLIREKKRRKQAGQSYRHVHLGTQLETIMQDWFSRHPGGRYTIATESGQPLTKDAANYHFNKVLEKSKWSVLKGFHVLRHSFASICAMRGVPDSVINSWMGHVTEEMQARYRHLYPEQSQKAMAGLFAASLFG